jgi:hypothetical protein
MHKFNFNDLVIYPLGDTLKEGRVKLIKAPPKLRGRDRNDDNNSGLVRLDGVWSYGLTGTNILFPETSLRLVERSKENT